MSIAKCLKWMFIIMSMPLFVQAYQGLVNQETAKGTPRSVGELVIGNDAVRMGWNFFGTAIACLVLSFLIWFFWERNED